MILEQSRLFKLAGTPDFNGLRLPPVIRAVLQKREPPSHAGQNYLNCLALEDVLRL